ncbi:hypothetical protein MPSEU_000317800 [Mayamaea pseudoterrestris]|nr:hypothetical protein MPSEU_000317800 [Mayamaea pseudoterrestris]
MRTTIACLPRISLLLTTNEMQSNQEKAAKDCTTQTSEFYADPLVKCLFRDGHTAPGFTMPLVAAWPVDEKQWGHSYERFVEAFMSCWEDESDWCSENPALYVYPLSHLHVTIATCFRDITRDVLFEERSTLVQKWKTILEHATRLPDWPTRPLELVLESAQVGTVACILLLKDITGGVQAVRKCLIQAVKELSHLQVTIFGIPDIIHSTFCRFDAIPLSRRSDVQERFSSFVLPALREIFPNPIVAPTCKLVSELRPYMHIPYDDEHVHATACFLKNERLYVSGRADTKSIL